VTDTSIEEQLLYDFADTMPQAVLDLADHPGIDDCADPARPPAAMGCRHLAHPYAAGSNTPSSASQRIEGGAPH
jgi:hypothetical protein